MKHYVLGFVFNCDKSQVLLVNKLRPDWQKGKLNGIGGKIEMSDKDPFCAIARECYGETGIGVCTVFFIHQLTFVCPGGTVYVFAGTVNSIDIPFEQKEDEILEKIDVDCIQRSGVVMGNLKWLIPLCLANVTKPIMIQQTTLGVE